MAGFHLPWPCIPHFSTIALTVSCCSADATCTATTNCVVNCRSQGIGPEAPNLSQIIPSFCHNQIIPELILEDNVIDHIPVNWLNGWRIKILNLAHNYLSNIEDGALNGTDCILERLFFHRSSRLVDKKRLTKATFQGLGCSLKRLNLDGTGLENDDLYALADLVHLEQLHMGDNGLTRIPEGVLSHLKDLSVLLLHGKTLVIPYYEQPFQGLDRMTKLDVHDNRLQTASYCTFGRFLGLRELNLDGNAWLVCNCTVWWLAQPPSRWPSSMLDCEAALREKCDGYVVPDCQPLLSQETMDPGSDAASAATATTAATAAATATATTATAASASDVSVNLEMAEIIAVFFSLAALIAIGITGFMI